jgi:hypothetical protein
MLKRRNIGKWLILILFICFLSSGFASADDNVSDNSSYTIPEYGPEFFNEIKKNPHFITSRGSFPDPTNDSENADFFSNPVYKCWSNVTENDQFIAELNDPVIGFSYAGAGCIVIELESDSSEKVNETTVDEIYRVIDDYCKHEGVNEVPVLFMWSHIEEDLPLPDYGPESFEKAKNEMGFIATRGTMPVITDADEKIEWTDLLVKCSQQLSRPNSNTGIRPYFTEFGGPVNSFGTNINGYLIVSFEESTPAKVNESVVDEVYQVVDEHFEQEGISDVPVVFTFVRITDDLAPADGPNANVSDNANLSGNKGEIASNETINKTPGFTSITVILGFLLLLIIKHSK